MTRKPKRPHNEQPISLAPVPFDEAVTDLLKTKPERKQDKLEALDRAGKRLDRPAKQSLDAGTKKR